MFRKFDSADQVSPITNDVTDHSSGALTTVDRHLRQTCDIVHGDDLVSRLSQKRNVGDIISNEEGMVSRHMERRTSGGSLRTGEDTNFISSISAGMEQRSCSSLSISSLAPAIFSSISAIRLRPRLTTSWNSDSSASEGISLERNNSETRGKRGWGVGSFTAGRAGHVGVLSEPQVGHAVRRETMRFDAI